MNNKEHTFSNYGWNMKDWIQDRMKIYFLTYISLAILLELLSSMAIFYKQKWVDRNEDCWNLPKTYLAVWLLYLAWPTQINLHDQDEQNHLCL